MRLFFVALAFVFVLLAAAGGARAGFEYYGIEDILSDTGTTAHSITLKFDMPVQNFEFPVSSEVQNLVADANFDVADCSVVNAVGSSLIKCQLLGMTSEKNLLKLSFNTNNGYTKIDKKTRFTESYAVPLPAARTSVLIKLPQKATLSEEPANLSYWPRDGNIGTDGKRILVYWDRKNSVVNEALQFSVSYNMQEEAFFSGDTFTTIAAAVAVIAVIIGATFYIRKVRAQKIVASVLNQDENKVVGVLTAHGGKVGQKIVVRETDFSKAKVSRIVRNLGERGIVRVEPISGRENRIILKPYGKKETKQKAETAAEGGAGEGGKAG